MQAPCHVCVAAARMRFQRFRAAVAVFSPEGWTGRGARVQLSGYPPAAISGKTASPRSDGVIKTSIEGHQRLSPHATLRTGGFRHNEHRRSYDRTRPSGGLPQTSSSHQRTAARLAQFSIKSHRRKDNRLRMSSPLTLPSPPSWGERVAKGWRGAEPYPKLGEGVHSVKTAPAPTQRKRQQQHQNQRFSAAGLRVGPHPIWREDDGGC